MSRLSKRASEIPPFMVMEILERAHALEQQGRKIIHLEVGEPDFQTPECICNAGIQAIKDGKTHYTHSLGIIELREAICKDYEKKYHVDIGPDQVIVTSGTSPAFFMIVSALLNPGDEIMMSNPHYPCYPNFADYMGAKPVFVNVYEKDGFQLDPDEIKDNITSRTKAVIINSPSNPTGNLLSSERIQEISGLGIPVISDEIYHGLVYGESAHSILEYTDNAFVVNGFSKLYAMTGWRLGYIIAPKDFVRPLQKIQQNFFISAGSMAQWAGLAALTEAAADVQQMVHTYDERRRYMIKRVRNMGFNLAKEPEGAFYVFFNAGHLSMDSHTLAFEILEKAGVGVTPGIDFGVNAEGYIRLCYANSLKNIKEGLDRLEAYFKEHF